MRLYNPCLPKRSTDHLCLKILRTRSMPLALHTREVLSLPTWRRAPPLGPDTQQRDQSMDHNLRAGDANSLPPHMLRPGRSESGGSQNKPQIRPAPVSPNKPGKPIVPSRRTLQAKRRATRSPAGQSPRRHAQPEEEPDATEVQPNAVPTPKEFPQWPKDLFQKPKEKLNDAIQAHGRAIYANKLFKGKGTASNLTCTIEDVTFVAKGRGNCRVSWQSQ